MRKPDGVIEIFLQPGELYFGDRYTRIRTILGSCVSLVFWHPTLLMGGMCHYLLPTRRHGQAQDGLDGRYGDEAMQLMLREIKACRARQEDFRVRLFGGGDMFPEINGRRAGKPIGQQNVEAARMLIRTHRLQCVGAHVEGFGHRHLLFDVWSGRVTLRTNNLADED
jgi:chemotaxis protein CheD